MGNKVLLLRLKELWNNPDKRGKWIGIMGISGILLIFFSQFIPKEKEPPEFSEIPYTAEAITASLEKKLATLVEHISGAGDTLVMVTLQNDGETLYVREQQTDLDTARTEGKTVSERESRTESYVLIDGKNGRDALIRTRMEPVIRGVVVACEGGDNPITEKRIMEAVTTALSISSAKVCITKLA